MKGDTLRAYHQIRELSRDHAVHLVAASENVVSDDALAEMQKYCASVNVVRIAKVRSFAAVAAFGIGSRLPLQVLYFRSRQLAAQLREVVAGNRFDIVHAMTIRVAPAVLPLLGIPVVTDFMDSYAANVATRRELVGPVVRRLYDVELSRVADYEREVARRGAGGVVIADLDREAIGDPRLAVIPNGVDMDALPFFDGERDAASLIFTGNMGYQPNVDAVSWFASACWPALRRRVPELTFAIVGARPAPAVQALGRIEGIRVVGQVKSMAPYLQRATVAVCPIRCGSGMQNKVLEAMSSGVPIVTTAFANKSIGAAGGREVEIAADNDAAGFEDAVVRLLSNREAARRQARAARAFVESSFAWSQRGTQLVEVYHAAIERHASIAALSNAG